MPAMPRKNDKTKKIAFNILGVPANMRDKKKPKDSRIDERLLYENTARVR